MSKTPLEVAIGFVTEQSCGEWDDKTIMEDAKKLVANVIEPDRARIVKLETDRAELIALVGRYLSTANIKTLEEALAITEIDDDARALLARLEADK